jgi:hypothetical protein
MAILIRDFVVLRWVDWGRADALIWREGANEKVIKNDKK